MEIKSGQSLMHNLYYSRDRSRDSEQTFLWLVEEVKEMAEAPRQHDTGGISEALADVLTWLFSLGNVLGVNLEDAFCKKYDSVCPKCKNMTYECA